MPSRTGTALLAMGGAMLLVSGCGRSGGGSASAAEETLHKQVCIQDDLGPDYREETAGDFSAGNLADLASNAGARKNALESAGLQGGYFAYWKHTVSNPPFAPPNEVVCQVMEFGTDAEAQAFVAAMRPTPEELVTTAMAWLPATNRAVEEEKPSSPASTSARAFRLTASDSDVSISLFALVEPDGRFVRSVYTGGQDSNTTLADAEAIEAKIAARVP